MPQTQITIAFTRALAKGLDMDDPEGITACLGHAGVVTMSPSGRTATFMHRLDSTVFEIAVTLVSG